MATPRHKAIPSEPTAVLQAILETVNDLSRKIRPVDFADLRYWVPDETCEAFTIEATLAGTARSFLAQFRVPDGMSGVIASIMCGGQSGNLSSSRIIITDRVEQAFGALVVDGVSGLYATGALTEVIVQSGVNPVTPGYCNPLERTARPTRLRLAGGRTYQALAIGTSSPVTCFLSLFGWTWPDKV